MSVFEQMDAHAESIPIAKLVLHVLQMVLGFIAWALEIAVFRADGAEVDGNNGWTFGVFFLSIPAWIYLVLTPRYPRTARFAMPSLMLLVDACYTIIWLSAFASQAAYNTADKCGAACGQSKAIVGLGVFICLLFAATTFLSAFTLHYYNWHNQLPGYGTIQARQTNPDPDKAAFSTAPHDEDAYARLDPQADDDDDDEHDPRYHGQTVTAPSPDPYAAPSPYVIPPVRQQAPLEPYGGASQVGGYGENPFAASETAYLGGGAGSPSGRYKAPAVHDSYDAAGPVQFPAANYDRT